MKVDILAFAAHPDDIELSCSGTLMKHIEMGKRVVVVDLTRGELGTRGTPELRLEEAERASRIMGIHGRENLELRDGFFRKDEESLLKVIAKIRKYQPEIVLCNSVEDRHIDHGRGGDLLEDACFLSGLRRIETTENGELQAPWRPKAVYHYIQDRFLQPNIVFDITEYFERKMQCVMAFSSQFYNPNSTEPATPISSKEFLIHLEGRALDFGRLIGTTYGEGFVTKRPIGSKNLLDQL